MYSRSTSLFAFIALFCVASLGACSCSSRGGTRPPGTRDLGMDFDGTVPGLDSGLDFGGAVNVCVPSCGPTELCVVMGDGNVLDDN